MCSESYPTENELGNQHENPHIHHTIFDDRTLMRTVGLVWIFYGEKYQQIDCTSSIFAANVLTAGEHEVAFVLIEGELAELHGLANHSDVAPES